MKKRIAVFCGSNVGSDLRFTEGARTMAKEMVSREIGLVYGGGNIGLMGVIADTVRSLNGEAIGVIPSQLMARELGHNGLSELIIVETMHERKAKMAELSQAFIAMPGGIGTLEEMVEVITWNQLGIHSKPCGFYNVAGYYDTFRQFLEEMSEKKFVKTEHLGSLIFESDANRMLDRIIRAKVSTVDKWYKSI